ncbi:hypothetical protein LCGC14_0607560, partial [marine sediment metagenome]
PETLETDVLEAVAAIPLEEDKEEPEPADLTDYTKEINAGYPKYLAALLEVATVLESTVSSDGTPVPEQPISLYKVKGEWKAAVVPLQKEEELKLLPPGPEEGKEPGNLILTTPMKVLSPGGNKEASPPTFIPLPPGNVTITKFIWTIPSGVPVETECSIYVGYGHEKYMIEGTFKSAGKAQPFPVDKGGVLKVSLLTTQPIEAWLELELEIKIELPKLMKLLGPMLSLPTPGITVANKQGFPLEILKTVLDGVAAAQESVPSSIEGDNKASVKILYEPLKESIYSGFSELNKQKIKDYIEQAVQEGKDKAAIKLAVLDEGQWPYMTWDIDMDNLVEEAMAATSMAVAAHDPALDKPSKPKLIEGEGGKGYKPKITAVNVGGKAVDAQELADALRSHLKNSSFTHYMIEESGHEFQKTKGILMHFKVSWAGDPELNLVKWALTNIIISKTITIHYKVGGPKHLKSVLGHLAQEI